MTRWQIYPDRKAKRYLDRKKLNADGALHKTMLQLLTCDVPF
jgi:hypothetical protein